MWVKKCRAHQAIRTIASTVFRQCSGLLTQHAQASMNPRSLIRICIVAAVNDKKAAIELTFYSHDIEDASPPSCTIQWDYSYKIPSDGNYLTSLLPGCYIEDSREGFHMTYFWFYVLDWV